MSDILKLQIGGANYFLDIEKATQAGALREEVKYNIGSYFRYDRELPNGYSKFFILFRDNNLKRCWLVNLRNGRQFSVGVDTESYDYVTGEEWEKLTVNANYADKLTLVTLQEVLSNLI